MNTELKKENELHNDNQITLTIANIEGSYTHEFNKHQTLQHVVDFTIEKLGLLIEISKYELVMGDGTAPLTLSSTIEQVNIADGSTLQLRKINGGGGESRVSLSL